MLSSISSELRRELLIGKITAPHGLKGAVRVQVLSDQPERFLELTSCLLLAQDESVLGEIDLESVSYLSPGMALLVLAGISDRQAAEKLRDHWLAVPRDQAIVLPQDRWFICDLLGCAVYDQDKGLLGRLTDVLQLHANDVYVVSQEGQNDLLVPILQHVLQKVDILERRIDLNLPDGLYEIYRKD